MLLRVFVILLVCFYWGEKKQRMSEGRRKEFLLYFSNIFLFLYVVGFHVFVQALKEFAS